MNEDGLSKVILDAAFSVHRTLGPGLFESVYEKVLSFELSKLGIAHQCQVSVPIIYKEMTIENAFIADIIVENKVILELKANEKITEVHKKKFLLT